MGEVHLRKGGGSAGLRRRGRGAGLGGVLVEREEELAVLEQRLAEAREGCGGVILIEGPAGKGKSRLLTIAGDMARKAEMLVLGAQATELERDFPFGVAIQLFEPRWLAADEETRERLLTGPARRAGELLDGTLPESTSPAGDQAYAVIHSLFRLLSNLVAPEDELGGEPLVMLVDDAHWADRPSLRFLAYAAERLSELPALLVVAVRSGEATADTPALMALRRASDRDVLRPSSLSPDGVAEIVQSRFPDADPAFCSACVRVTGGNPFLLTKLLDQLEVDGRPPTAATAAGLEDLAPESVLDAVVARLGAMEPDARRVASAVAVLGDGAHLHRVAELAGLDSERAGRAADALAAAHFFHPGSPLSFVHPLIASAVKASMSPLDRGRAHCQAASILADDDEPPEQVAVHLLVCPPQSDFRAVEILRAAARKALGSGAVDSAVRMLERALAEDPPPEVYPEILAELGQAESAAGLPQAVDRLEDALKVTDETPRRAELALSRGRALLDQGRASKAAEVIAAALEEGEGDGLGSELEAAYVTAALQVPELNEEARTRGAQMVDGLSASPTPSQRHAIAHLAMHHSLRGAPRQHVRELAELAWGDGALLDDPEPLVGAEWPLLTGALLFADELELDLSISDAALEAARRRSSPAALAVASYCRVWPLYKQGRIAEAAAAAQAAIDARPEGRETYLRPAYGAVACCHLQRGQLEQAEVALSIVKHPSVTETSQLPFLLDVRAQLRLAQLRPSEALADALEAGRLLEGATSPGALAWRSTAALAHLALGDPDRARRFATEELEEAERFETTRVVIRDLRVLGLAERGEPGIKLLRRAVRIGERYPVRLEYIRALIDLGGALRRANQRTAAREPLRKALELSHGGGARALEQRARDELTATGARPRREMLSGLASLTPSERRVGEHAARGLTTRQIAEVLFVTPKTVEFHLRHIYRKLDVSSRAELTEAMGEDVDAA